MSEWLWLLIVILLAWAALKVVGMMLKIALWLLLAAAAYFFFAHVFNWPLP